MAPSGRKYWYFGQLLFNDNDLISNGRLEEHEGGEHEGGT